MVRLNYCCMVMDHMVILGNGFSSAKYSLIDRGIIWANAHIRGGMECGMQWWKNGKMLKKKIHLKIIFNVLRNLLTNDIHQKD